MQEWSENTDFLMYLTHIQGNSVISEKFVKTLKAKIYTKWRLMRPNLILVIIISLTKQLLIVIILLLLKKARPMLKAPT